MKKTILSVMCVAMLISSCACSCNNVSPEAAAVYAEATAALSEIDCCSFDISVKSRIDLGEKAEEFLGSASFLVKDISAIVKGYLDSDFMMFDAYGNVNPVIGSLEFQATSDGNAAYFKLPWLSRDVYSVSAEYIECILSLLFNIGGNFSALDSKTFRTSAVRYSSKQGIIKAYRFNTNLSSDKVNEMLSAAVGNVDKSSYNAAFFLKFVDIKNVAYSLTAANGQVLQQVFTVDFDALGELCNYVKSAVVSITIDIYDANQSKAVVLPRIS